MNQVNHIRKKPYSEAADDAPNAHSVETNAKSLDESA
jgi:hypothetical protein